MSKIRIGVVGCGRISKSHFDSIKAHQNSLQLVSLCDVDSKKLEEQKKEYKVNAYTNLEDMLKNEELDLVSICTPSGYHSNQTILCAKYKVNVITEKPMATSWEDGINMVKACEDAGVKLFVVKQNRFNHTLKLLKTAIDENRFGNIHMVQVNVFWNRPQKYYDQAEWRGTWELDGGAFMNQASHYVDLLDWLIGPIDKIHAMASTTRDIEVEDTGVMNIKWRSGALGSMSVTMLTYKQNLEGSITILGEKGTVKIGGVAVNDIQYWEFEDKKTYDESINEVSYNTASVYGFGHPLYYENVIKVFENKIKPETDGREGLKSLEVLIAAYRSAKIGKTVSLPLTF